MKKLIALIMLAVTSPVFAQAVATLPTAPTPPSIITTSPNATDANSVATTNKVYIDQAGSTPNVNIQQTGTSNILGTLADPVYLRGDNFNIIGIQTGNSNSLLMGIIGQTGGQNASVTATIRQIGNNNTADIRCGTYQGDAACNGLNLNDRFTGNNNSLNFHGSASNITQTIDAAGNNNAFTITVSSPNASQTLLFTGDYNTINATQTDAGGTYGHSLREDFTGTSNTVTTQQYGATETVINVKSVGTNGNWNIKTGH